MLLAAPGTGAPLFRVRELRAEAWAAVAVAGSDAGCGLGAADEEAL